MPHAALWVVQLFIFVSEGEIDHGFNAARGFVGGAALRERQVLRNTKRFNAARGFVGGAATVL